MAVPGEACGTLSQSLRREQPCLLQFRLLAHKLSAFLWLKPPRCGHLLHTTASQHGWDVTQLPLPATRRPQQNGFAQADLPEFQVAPGHPHLPGPQEPQCQHIT